MKTNTKERNKRRTHEGAKASSINVRQELERIVMSCMLWENTFYESGSDLADRITVLISCIVINPSKRSSCTTGKQLRPACDA